MKQNIVIIMASLLISACASTPTGQIEAFGVAAADVTAKIDTVISDYNQTNIDNKLAKMAQRNKKYTTSDLDPIRDILIRDSDKKNFALYKANNALGAYASSLTELASAGSREQMARASVKLNKSLNSMNKNYKIIKGTSDDLLSAEKNAEISRVIAEISSFYAENKRAKALKKIIINSDSQIQLIGEIINEQLLKSALESRIYTMRGTVLAGYFADYNKTTDKKSFASRKKSLDFMYRQYIEMQATGATILQAQNAITSVIKAHSVLKSELEKDQYTSKKIFKSIGEIVTVHKSYDDLEALMVNCETEVITDDNKGIICKE